MAPSRRHGESLDSLFETVDIDYQVAADVAGRTYAFTVWPDPDATTAADFGRYLAVVDAHVDDDVERHRVYRKIRTDGDRCYIPGDLYVDAVDEPVLEQNGMKQRALQEFAFDAEMEQAFVAAYETTRDSLDG